MKKYFIIIICFIVGGGVLLLLEKIIELDKQNKQKNNIESFEYFTLKNKKITFNLNNTQNTFFIYFNSECEFCQMKAKEISESNEAIRDYEIFFISDEEISDITKFSKKWKLDNIDNIHFLKDSNQSFKNKFNIKIIPSIVFYGKNNVYFYKGSYSLKYILNEVDKENYQ